MLWSLLEAIDITKEHLFENEFEGFEIKQKCMHCKESGTWCQRSITSMWQCLDSVTITRSLDTLQFNFTISWWTNFQNWKTEVFIPVTIIMGKMKMDYWWSRSHHKSVCLCQSGSQPQHFLPRASLEIAVEASAKDEFWREIRSTRELRRELDGTFSQLLTIKKKWSEGKWDVLTRHVSQLQTTLETEPWDLLVNTS